MKNLSRRDFLRMFAATLAALAFDQFLIACGKRASTFETDTTIEARPTPTRDILPTRTPGTISEELQTRQELEPFPTSKAPNDTYLVVARGDGSGMVQPEDLVRRGINALGGMERFVPRGANVIVKPNICVAYHTYEYAATTNPWVVATLVKLSLEAGANKVVVMDAPFGGTAEEAYARSGIADQVKIAGGEMVVMSHLKYAKTELPKGQDLKDCEIYDEILKADVLIDVPIAKHHQLAGLTLGMKNLMGVIRNRQAIHRNIGQRLADLTSHIYPTLTVIDAVRMLMDHGPTGGDLGDVKLMDTIIASPDIVAADSYAATLFGKKPDDLSYVKAGVAMQLGRSDLDKLKIEVIPVGT